MNRIAVKIKEARLKAKMTEKQLAKKCGLAESYIIQVESGRKVINEKVADKILGVLGTKVELVHEKDLDRDKWSSIKEQKKVKQPKESFQPIQPTEQWSNALANIIRKFPIYSLQTNKIVGYKELPVIGKKIEGHHWEKITFVQCPDDQMSAFRIRKKDVIMVCLTTEINNNGIYLFEINKKKMIRQLRKEGNNKVVLSKGIKGEEPVVVDHNQIKLIGQCIKGEFEIV